MWLATSPIHLLYEPICVGHSLLDQHFIFSPQYSELSLLFPVALLLVSYCFTAFSWIHSDGLYFFNLTLVVSEVSGHIYQLDYRVAMDHLLVKVLSL